MRVLYHVSEEPGIDVFRPRSPDTGGDARVWAIDGAHLRNYLVPRECPRVAYAAGPRTTAADRERFLGSSSAVLAIEAGWFARVRSARLYCYHLPPAGFELTDECAGYFVSSAVVTAVGVQVIGDPLSALLERGVELRIQPDLWALHDAVLRSTLAFSVIRWRNAAPQSARLLPSPPFPGEMADGI